MSAAPTPDRRAAQARAGSAWADLRDRLATVTPAALGRAILGGTVIAVVAGFIVGTWPAMLPFVIGGLLAYAVLPVVDGLDRIMPRSLAAVLAMLAVVAALVGILVVVVPPLTTAILDLTRQIPRSEEIDRLVADLLQGLPPTTQDVLGPILVAVAETAKSGLSGASGGLRDIVPVVLQAALGVAGAILGLIVLPAWMLTVLSDKRRATRAIDRRFAGWLRPDAWAVLRMFDRAAGTYLRGFVVVAAMVGLFTWIGLQVAHQLGGPVFTGALAIAVFAGAVQVVPELGPILGFVPALLLLAYDPQRAGIYVIVYLISRWLGGSLLGGRVVEDRLRVHPAILIPGVVVLSQIGPIALLLSAPILAFGSDLVRYVHGRLSEPPRPAGLLPDEPVPSPDAAAGAATPRRTPSVYRRAAARRVAPATTMPTTPSTTPAAPRGAAPTR